MRLSLAIPAALFSAAILLSPSARAEVFQFTTMLDAIQSGGGARTGSGSGDVTYDDATGLLSWNISWGGLSGTANLAHFHGPATPGNTASPVVTIDHTMNPNIDSDTISLAEGNDLLAELWYVNIHSTNFPTGEIRGQVLLIPEPASMLAMGLGGVGLIGLVRVRYRRE